MPGTRSAGFTHLLHAPDATSPGVVGAQEVDIGGWLGSGRTPCVMSTVATVAVAVAVVVVMTIVWVLVLALVTFVVVLSVLVLVVLVVPVVAGCMQAGVAGQHSLEQEHVIKAQHCLSGCHCHMCMCVQAPNSISCTTSQASPHMHI